MQIKLPKGAFRKGAIVGGIAACLVLALVGGLRFVIPLQARPGDDLMTDGHKVARQEVAQNVQGNCNIVGSENTNNSLNCTTPPHESNGLYQGPKQVGVAQILKTEQDGTIIFDARFTSFVDPGRDIEYGNKTLRCENAPVWGRGGLPPAQVGIALYGLKCVARN
jgi:hypothetical protein